MNLRLPIILIIAMLLIAVIDIYCQHEPLARISASDTDSFYVDEINKLMYPQISDPYLYGRLQTKTSKALYKCYNSQLENQKSWWDRPAHVGGLMLTLAYGGYVDVLVHSSRNKKDPNYKHVNGLPYLGGFGVTLLGNVYTSFNLGKKNYSSWRFVLDTVAGIILGSIAWDYIYLKTQYDDGGKPVERWYTMNLGGKEHVWGFGSHKEFFMFNVARLLVGIILLMIPV